MTLRRLIWYRIRILLSGVLHGKSRVRLIRLLVTVLIIAIGFGGVFYAFHTLFGMLRGAGQTGLDISKFVIIATLHGIFFIALTIDIATTMSIFFLSSDLNLLMASPLSTTKVFSIKYIDAMASSSLLSIILALPAAIAFGVSASAPAIYYPCVVVVLLFLLSIPVSIGTLVGLSISRYASPRRIREVLGLVGSLFGLAIWLAIQVLGHRVSSSQVHEISGFSQAMSRHLSSPVMRLLPSTYASKALISFSTCDWSVGILNLSILLLLGSVVLVGSIQVAKKAYLTGWIRTSSAASTQVRRSKFRLPSPLFFLPRFEGAVANTTLRTYLRDAQQVSQFATLAIMLVVLAIVPGMSGQKHIALETRLINGLFYLAFIGAFNIAMTLMIIDGKSFWLIIASPVSPLRKVISKIVASLVFLLPVVLILVAALAITRQIQLATSILVLPAIIAISIAGASTGSAVSLHYANWDWENPKRMHRLGGRMVMIILLLLFIAISNIGFRYLGNSLTSSSVLRIMLAATLPVSSLVTLLSIIICSRELSRIEWRV